jgi:hypothetical protein
MWRPEALDVATGPDLLEVVHVLGGDRHRAMRVAEQVEVGPEAATCERHVTDADGLVLQHVHVRAGGRRLGLLHRAVDVGSVGFMVAGDVDAGLVRHAVGEPPHAPFHARDEVAGDD